MARSSPGTPSNENILLSSLYVCVCLDVVRDEFGILPFTGHQHIGCELADRISHFDAWYECGDAVLGKFHDTGPAATKGRSTDKPTLNDEVVKPSEVG